MRSIRTRLSHNLLYQTLTVQFARMLTQSIYGNPVYVFPYRVVCISFQALRTRPHRIATGFLLGGSYYLRADTIRRIGPIIGGGDANSMGLVDIKSMQSH